MRSRLGATALGVGFVLLAGCRTTITVPPPAPASVSVEALPGGAMVGWSDVGAHEYEVLAGSGSSLTVVATTTVPTVRLRHLTPDIAYRIEVRPKGGSASAAVSVVPLPWLDRTPLWTVDGVTPGGGLGVSLAPIDTGNLGRINLIEAGEPFAGAGQLDDFYVDETGLFGDSPVAAHAPFSQSGAEAGLASAGSGNVLAIGVPGADGVAAGEGALVVIGVDGTARTMSAPASVAGGAFGASLTEGEFAQSAQVGFATGEPGASRILIASTGATAIAAYAGSTGDRDGAALATWPASDADALDRLVVGEPGHAGGAGQIEILSFAGGAPASQWTADGAGGDGLGSELVIADVDGDGLDDLIAGGACGGRVRVYAGGTDLPSTSPLAVLTGPGCFGRSLTRVDPAGDGEPLLVVGAPSGTSAPGEILVYDGADLAAGPVWVQTGGSPAFGSSAFGGPLGTDGREQLVVGDPGDPSNPLAVGQLELFRRRRDHGPSVNGGFTMTARAGEPVTPVLPTFDDPDLAFSSWTCTWTWDATLGTAGQAVIPGCTPANVGATSWVYPTSGPRPVLLRVTNELDGRWGEALVAAEITAP